MDIFERKVILYHFIVINVGVIAACALVAAGVPVKALAVLSLLAGASISLVLWQSSRGD